MAIERNCWRNLCGDRTKHSACLPAHLTPMGSHLAIVRSGELRVSPPRHGPRAGRGSSGALFPSVVKRMCADRLAESEVRPTERRQGRRLGPQGAQTTTYESGIQRYNGHFQNACFAQSSRVFRGFILIVKFGSPRRPVRWKPRYDDIINNCGAQCLCANRD